MKGKFIVGGLGLAIVAAGGLYLYLHPLYEGCSNVDLRIHGLGAPPAKYFTLTDADVAQMPSDVAGAFDAAFREGNVSRSLPESTWRQAASVLEKLDHDATGQTTRAFEHAGAFYAYEVGIC